MSTVYINTASATTTPAIIIDTEAKIPAHFVSNGLAGAEVCKIQAAPDGATFGDYYVEGSIAQMTATDIGKAVYVPGVYRLVKAATAGTVIVGLSHWHNA